MFKEIPPIKKHVRAIVCGIWSIMVCSVLTECIKSQETAEFDKPFKVCRIYPLGGGATQITASDNNTNFIFTNESNYLLSVNPESKLENWKSLAGGKLYPVIVADNDSVYFLSSFENEAQRTNYILNSISQKTGITNWQKKLDGYSNIKLFESADKETIYLTAENHNLLAVRKKDGNLNWTKNLQAKVISIATRLTSQISVLTEKSLFQLSTENGTLLSQTKIKSAPASESIGGNGYVWLGYPNGELLKISSAGKVAEVLWKIKTGGNISSVIELENEVLISSYDNFLYLYSVSSGKLKWKRRVSGRINLKPLIVKKHAIVLSATDSVASIIELDAGKIINQIVIEDGNYFSDEPIILGKFIIFPTFRGVYLFVNSDSECR